MERDLHFDSDWPVALVFALMVAFILGLTPTGHKILSELLNLIVSEQATQATRERPDVLVATANSDDQKTVAATVLPRGYNVVFADTTAIARQVLQSDPNRIGLIVVDAKSRDARGIAHLARSVAPHASLIRLPASHGSTEVATLLLAAIRTSL